MQLLLSRGKDRLQPTFQTQARQDVVGWLSAKDASESGVATTAAMELLRGVAYELNEALALGLAVPQQCMCACYGAPSNLMASVQCIIASVQCREFLNLMFIIVPRGQWSALCRAPRQCLCGRAR